MNTTTNQSLFDVVESLDNTARIPALRALTHSAMAKCIGAIRQHLREQERTERQEDSSSFTDVAPVDRRAMQDLDMRNQTDENTRSVEEITRAMGFSTEVPPLKQASLFHAVYDWAYTDLRTLITSKWDAPLTVEQMLEFMTKSAPKLDHVLAQALADAAKTDVKTIERMHELQSQREREQLIEATPEIVLTFKGLGENGYADAIDELPKVVQHQLGIKVVESLNKARDQVLARVLRTRRIADLASVPIIEDAAKQVSNWVEQFEHRYGDEISEAIDAGRNVRTLEDIGLDGPNAVTAATTAKAKVDALT